MFAYGGLRFRDAPPSARAVNDPDLQSLGGQPGEPVIVGHQYGGAGLQRRCGMNGIGGVQTIGCPEPGRIKSDLAGHGSDREVGEVLNPPSDRERIARCAGRKFQRQQFGEQKT